jgi:hypothetical protein
MTLGDTMYLAILTKLQISTFDRSETRHDVEEFLRCLGASVPATRKINFARRVQRLQHLCGCEFFGVDVEDPLDQSPRKNILFDNRRRLETRIVRLRAFGEAGH